MQKNSVFLAASFGDLLLNEKQKNSFVYWLLQVLGILLNVRNLH